MTIAEFCVFWSLFADEEGHFVMLIISLAFNPGHIRNEFKS